MYISPYYTSQFHCQPLSVKWEETSRSNTMPTTIARKKGRFFVICWKRPKQTVKCSWPWLAATVAANYRCKVYRVWTAPSPAVNYNVVLSSVDGCQGCASTLTWRHNLISSDFTVLCVGQLVNDNVWPTWLRCRWRRLVITSVRAFIARQHSTQVCSLHQAFRSAP